MRKQDKNKGKQKKRQEAARKAKATRQASGFGQDAGAGRQPSGFRIPDNWQPDLEDIKALARKGMVSAQKLLAACYLLGQGGAPSDAAEAAKWYQMAIDSGDAQACSDLGALYFKGWCLPQDLAKARGLFAKGAERGDPVSTYGLACCLEEGLGGARDPDEAARLFEQAAGLGVKAAACRLMQLRLDPPASGTTPDPEAFARALALLEKACAQRFPEAMRIYAGILLSGQGVEADPARAVDLLDDAARTQASEKDLADCFESLQDASSSAWGDLGAVIASPDLPAAVCAKARARLEQGAAQQIRPALDVLGTAFLHGLGVPQDYAEARRIFGQADSPAGRSWLGAMAFWGLDGQPDRQEGMRRMEEAAGNGSLIACALLARIYARGDGGWPADAGRAERWRAEAERLMPAAFNWETLLAPAPLEEGEAWLEIWQ